MDSKRKKSIMKAFGAHLKRIREGKGVSLRVLEQLSEIDHSQIHRIEKGDSSPSLITLVALSEAMEISLEKLLVFEED